jgi:hypothetical protein
MISSLFIPTNSSLGQLLLGMLYLFVFTPTSARNYDMIIGRDILHSLGINFLFDTAEISWDNGCKDRNATPRNA